MKEPMTKERQERKEDWGEGGGEREGRGQNRDRRQKGG